MLRSIQLREETGGRLCRQYSRSKEGVTEYCPLFLDTVKPSPLCVVPPRPAPCAGYVLGKSKGTDANV